MFIRKKRINGQYYAYLVTNRWTSKGTRQKAKYLGKVITLEQDKHIQLFKDYMNINYSQSFKEYLHVKTFPEGIQRIIEYTLLQHGFELSQHHSKSSSTVKLASNTQQVLIKKAPALEYYKNKVINPRSKAEQILEIHEGFLCEYSIKKLLNVKVSGYDEREQGIILAKALLEAGLRIENESFVSLFEKWIEERAGKE